MKTTPKERAYLRKANAANGGLSFDASRDLLDDLDTSLAEAAEWERKYHAEHKQLDERTEEAAGLAAEVAREKARAETAERETRGFRQRENDLIDRVHTAEVAQRSVHALRASVTRLQGEVERKDEALVNAWGIIANAHNGNWNEASAEWREAAKRWREEDLKSSPAGADRSEPKVYCKDPDCDGSGACFTGGFSSEQQTSENKALERGRSADLSPGGGSEEPGNPNIAKRECGCEASIADGFLYKTCDQHVTSNPCFPYWDWEAQQRALDRQKAPHSAGASDEAERGTIERLMDIAARASISSDPDAWANGVNECCDMIRARDRATRLAAIEECALFYKSYERENRAPPTADEILALAEKAPGAK